MNDNRSMFLNTLVILDLEDQTQDSTGGREALLGPRVKVVLLDNSLFRG